MSDELVDSLTDLIERARREVPYAQRRELATLLTRRVKPTPEELHKIRSEVAHISWINTKDRTARTANARAGLNRKFLEMADGDPVRAAELRSAHYADLAQRSAAARRAKREALS